MPAEKRTRVLTLYFTKNERTFNPSNFRTVLQQEGVDQDIYVVSAEPVNIGRHGFSVPNIVVPTRQSWPVPVRIGYSFNAALAVLKHQFSVSPESYDYIFKVDGDVSLPPDYLRNLVAKGAPVAGFGPAMLISTGFFYRVLGGKYPVNHCDDGYLLAVNIAFTGRVARYTGTGELSIPEVGVDREREFAYGVEYYKWGVPAPLLLVLPVTRVYLRVLRKMKKYQEKPLVAYLYNYSGYLHAVLRGYRKYSFHRAYSKMRVKQLFTEFLG